MPRVSPLYERPVALSGDFEEGEAASDESALHTRMKLGAAWSFATLAGVAALAVIGEVFSEIIQ